MRPNRSLLFALLALVGLSGPALADPGHGPGGPGEPGQRLEEKLKTLGLDPSQQEKIQSILDAAKPQRDQLRAQMRDAWMQMRTLLDADTPDQASVLAQADKISSLNADRLRERFKTMLAVRAELTPDQRAKLKAEMMQHGHGGWRHRHGRMGGGPDTSGAPSGTPSGPPPEE